jgi:hypothetical protein
MVDMGNHSNVATTKKKEKTKHRRFVWVWQNNKILISNPQRFRQSK